MQRSRRPPLSSLADRGHLTSRTPGSGNRAPRPGRPISQRSWRLRKYKDEDFLEIARLHQEGFVSSSKQSVAFSFSVPGTTVFVAEAGGTVVGTAMTVAFGRTAWIGGVVVSPAWQRRGIATALTEHVLDVALDRAETVLLLAVEPARRLYNQLGFINECTYGTWTLPPSQGTAGRLLNSLTHDGDPGPRSRAASTIMSCIEIDCTVTGEVRAPYLLRVGDVIGADLIDAVLMPASGGKRGTASAGYAAQLPWGAGPVIATDPGVGARLVRNVLAANPTARIEFPDTNETGLALMRELGLTRVDDDYRMRVGPPVAGFHPEFIYKVLTPSVG
jgi:GNAT superfamily N-acetyltransferase